MNKKSKVVAITGAYSGLGAALAQGLAKKEYSLILGGRNKQSLNKFTEKIKKITTAEAVFMDVKKKSDCQKLIQTAVTTFGRLDILINNAGFLGKKTATENIAEEELKETFETNVYGPFFCTQEALKIMKQQNAGHILNIGSTSAIDNSSSNLAYGSSKSALIGMTATLRNELSNSKIKVTCFNPAGIKTNIFKKYQPERNISDFMNPSFVALKIIEHIESNSKEWNLILREP